MHSLRFFATTVSIIALSSAAFAETAAPASALSKADVAVIVKETIMNDPEIIMQALEKLRVQKTEQARKDAAAALEKNKAGLFNNADVPSAGASAANADLTIVEFFDYHCGYCKHFLPEVAKVIAADKKLRVLFIDFPILSEDSVTAARAAIAVNRLDKTKYFAFHSELMKQSGKFDEKVVLELAKKVGIKVEALKAEMAKPEVTDILDKHRALASDLGITGTPGLIIGNEVIPGAMSADELQKAIAGARSAAKGGAAK